MPQKIYSTKYQYTPKNNQHHLKAKHIAIPIIEDLLTLIKQCNLIPYKDINIKFVGLRKGEKLVEETLDYNSMDKTSNNHIYSINCNDIKDIKEILMFLKQYKKNDNIKKAILDFTK